ncbi:MAG: diaminopimelate epimerase [Bacteroidales bacterium]
MDTTFENNFFVKSHGLGNDYIVLDEEKLKFSLTTELIMRICDYHFGIGSDGILLKVNSHKADFGVRIFNPDGSEAEKSGNGLRIFAKFLWDYGYTNKKTFCIETIGGIAQATITETNSKDKAQKIKVEIGKPEFFPARIPVNSPLEIFLNQPLIIEDRKFLVNCVSVGNPHCVILTDYLNEQEVRRYGPLLERHILFPNKINVQFAKVIDRNNVKILIWERGAGYTLASGTSSCAVAAVCYKANLIDADVNIHMQGGILKVNIDKKDTIYLEGTVQEIAFGYISSEII